MFTGGEHRVGGFMTQFGGVQRRAQADLKIPFLDNEKIHQVERGCCFLRDHKCLGLFYYIKGET